MRSLESIYNRAFFKNRRRLIWRADIICPAIVNTFDLKTNFFTSIVDVGCAIGEYVKKFLSLGINAYGIEGSKSVENYALAPIVIADLRSTLEPYIFSKQLLSIYNLCMSLEVAEHIEEEYVDKYLDNLCLLSDNVMITAAPPGQEGVGHFNCKEKEYWEEKFLGREYKRDIEKEKKFQKQIELYKDKKSISMYYKNVMIYYKD